MTDCQSITNTKNSPLRFKDKCNALDCKSIPTVELDIDCGKYGSLTIFVCNSCIHKFRKEE